jgi:hypothetical protein
MAYLAIVHPIGGSILYCCYFFLHIAVPLLIMAYHEADFMIAVIVGGCSILHFAFLHAIEDELTERRRMAAQITNQIRDIGNLTWVGG